MTIKPNAVLTFEIDFTGYTYYIAQTLIVDRSRPKSLKSTKAGLS